jgi:hypothetical protein
VEPSIHQLLADYLRSVAAWRRQRYQDDLRDTRNLRSAGALEELAEHVLALPPDDERLKQLDRLAIEGEAFVPGQQTSYEIGRFHFFSDEAGLDAFVDRILELAMADKGEQGRFGGLQVPGDDPWEPS